MKRFVDVVNFNADASCLSTAQWFAAMSGGESSDVCRWLRLYRDLGKKIVIGFTGATVADLAIFNPEALGIVRSAPEIFQVIARPFSHDIALLRSEAGYRANLELGLKVLEVELGTVTPYFLPPEFMLTNEQVGVLEQYGIRGTFINPGRFSPDIQLRLPDSPYVVKGVFGSSLECIPFEGACTGDYLHAIHLFDDSRWNSRIKGSDAEVLYIWRDGESTFFLPDGVERERAWLMAEDAALVRDHLGGEVRNFVRGDQPCGARYLSYPVHSFLPWMREFRMIAFVNRIVKVEQTLPVEMKGDRHFAWLLAIGSDIFSAIEKQSPVIQLKAKATDKSSKSFTIMRSERGYEGEEALILAEKSVQENCLPVELLDPSGVPHHRRYLARIKYLRNLISGLK